MAKKCPIAPKDLVQLYEKAGRIYADKSISLLSDKVLEDVLKSDGDYNLTDPGDVDRMGGRFVDSLYEKIADTNEVTKEQGDFFNKIDVGLQSKTGEEYKSGDLYDRFFEGAYSQVENYYQDNKTAIVKSAMKMDLSAKKTTKKSVAKATPQDAINDATPDEVSRWARFQKIDLSQAKKQGISDEMIAKRVWWAMDAPNSDDLDAWIDYADRRGWDAEKIDIFLGMA